MAPNTISRLYVNGREYMSHYLIIWRRPFRWVQARSPSKDKIAHAFATALTQTSVQCAAIVHPLENMEGKYSFTDH